MRKETTYKAYDQLGNILQMKSVGNWTRDYFYNTNDNKLLGHTDGTTEYTYDAHCLSRLSGRNILTMPYLQALNWDYKDQLVNVELDASGNKAYYVYDASGNRVRKVVEKGNVIEERFYVGDYEVYRKTTSGTLDVERETVHISDDQKRIAMIDNDGTTETIRYQIDNHLGSSSLELDENAVIISYEEYHPFGTTSYHSSNNENEVKRKRYRYVGKERDEETGLYNYGFRLYAPWLGRFVSIDSLQHDYPQLTPFNYAGNKPVTHKDIDGLQSTGDKKINMAFGPKITPEAIANNPQNENWVGYELHSLNQVKQEMDSLQAKGYQISSVYLNTHGYNGGAALGEGENGSINAEGATRAGNGYYHFIDSDHDDTFINEADLNWYKGLSEKDKEEFRELGSDKLKVIENLLSISKNIEDNGAIIFGGCDIGSGDEGKLFLENLFALTGKRISIVANTEKSISTQERNDVIKPAFKRITTKRTGEKVVRDTVTIPKEVLNYKILLDKGLTDPTKQGGSKGWRIIGPQTNGVQTTGKDLFLNSKGKPYEFKNFQKYTIPSYFK